MGGLRSRVVLETHAEYMHKGLYQQEWRHGNDMEARRPVPGQTKDGRTSAGCARTSIGSRGSSPKIEQAGRNSTLEDAGDASFSGLRTTA